MQNNINTYPVQQFIEQVKLADMTQQREIRLDIKNAKTLAFTLGEMAAKINQDYESFISKFSDSNNQNIEVRMEGGKFR